jgi:hypothetical protein
MNQDSANITTSNSENLEMVQKNTTIIEKDKLSIEIMNMIPETQEQPKTIETPINNSTKQNTILDHLEEMYNYVKLTVGNNNITASSIMVITNNLMQIVEKYKDLTGNQKKMLVIDTIKRFINETINDSSDKNNLLMIADLTLPTVIDTLVSAINGDIKFDVKKVKTVFNNLFGCCCKK